MSKKHKASMYQTATTLPPVDWDFAIRGIQSSGNVGYRGRDRDADMAWIRDVAATNHTVESLWYGELCCGRGWGAVYHLSRRDRRRLGICFLPEEAKRMIREAQRGWVKPLSESQQAWCEAAIARPEETAEALLDRHMIRYGDPCEGGRGPLTSSAINFFD
jgi:hypothetical protein